MSTTKVKEIPYFTESGELDKDVINLNDWNPNFENSKIYESVKDDIKKNGFIGHIILQKHNKRLKKDNVIINGEHRYRALVELGKTSIPVIILDVDDNTAKTLSIRLNREHGELLPHKVASILADLSPDKDIGLLENLTHIDKHDLELLTEINIIEDASKFDLPKKGKGKSKTEFVKHVECPECGHKFSIA